MKSIVFKNYPDEKYKVIFNQKTGFFARVEEKGSPEVFWAKKGPELLDISITNWCNKGCEICYRNSNKNGTHISLEDYEFIMKQAFENNVLQVALGGGNPNQHPQFVEILKLTKEKYNIVPSYTTNGRGLTPEILEATKNYCGAVAVSAYEPFDETKQALKLLASHNIKVNLHYILDSKSIERAIDWLEKGHELLEQCNAIIFLNYKPVGNDKKYSLLLKNSPLLRKFFDLIDNKQYSYKIGFDSCMVSGIVKNMKNVNLTSLEPCDAARFSAYISEDLKMYPCSFMMEHYQGESIRQKTFMEIWNHSDSFQMTRSALDGSRCGSCNQRKNCLNGCPFLREIDICQSNVEQNVSHEHQRNK
ncbi:radical SAM/SPASM domain-containing protein [Aliarcobacter butzleri]|uniref:radical SAM protein n=1 Tax=Aliarcobacter butzleri TaxID=28197 RepID=UPI003AFAB99B